MKYKILSLILICALLSNIGAATTENKDLPTEKENTEFIATFETTSGENYLSSFYDAYIEEFPMGHIDIWPDGFLSIYHTADNARGYGSIYIDGKGKILSPGCGSSQEPVKSYKGEYKEEEVTKPTEEVKEDVKEDVKEEDKETVTEEPEEDKETITEDDTEEDDGLYINLSVKDISKMTKEQKLKIVYTVYNVLMGE